MSDGGPDDAYRAVVDDLAAEGDTLDAVVGGLDPAGAGAPTSAAGWTVGDTIAHLAGAAWLAAVSLTEPDAFADRLAGAGRPAAPAGWAAVLGRWRTERARVVAGLRAAVLGIRLEACVADAGDRGAVQALVAAGHVDLHLARLPVGVDEDRDDDETRLAQPARRTRVGDVG